MSETQIKQFGRYWLVNKLGEGGMGEVFRAYSIGPDGIKVPYAIKVLRKNDEVDQERLKMFRTEAVLASKLKHNCIGSFIEFMAEKGEYALVMEFIEGLTLADLFNDLRRANQTLPLPFALYLAAQISDGLAYLHRYEDPATGEKTEVIHGDLSPQNVVVNFEGEVKLIDFGLARLQREYRTDLMKTNYANAWYASPERINRQSISASDDIFGFGLVLWELVMGARYHGMKNQAEVVNDLGSFKPRNPREAMPSIPESLAKIIDGCLNAENLNGYQSMEELQRDIHLELKRVEPGFIGGHFRDFLKRSYAKRISDAREATHRYGKLVDDHSKSNLQAELAALRSSMGSGLSSADPTAQREALAAVEMASAHNRGATIIGAGNPARGNSASASSAAGSDSPLRRVASAGSGAAGSPLRPHGENFNQPAEKNVSPASVSQKMDDRPSAAELAAKYEMRKWMHIGFGVTALCAIAWFGFKHSDKLDELKFASSSETVQSEKNALLEKIDADDMSRNSVPTTSQAAASQIATPATGSATDAATAQAHAETQKTREPSNAEATAKKIISIYSLPSNASVYKEGAMIGTTPLSIEATPGKGYSLMFEHPNHNQLTIIVDGSPKTLNVNLEYGDYTSIESYVEPETK